MEPLCMVALTSCVPAETLHANLHDGGIEMWGAPVGLEKVYLSIWRAIMSSMLQSISWIPATNNFYQVGSREPYRKLWGSFFPLVSDRTASWHATADSNIIHLTCNIFLCACVVGVRVGQHTCGMFRRRKNGKHDACTDCHDVFRAAQDTL